MKVIVIGGVAAGMSAASKIKRIDSNVVVNVYEKGNFLSYGACGLPYYVSGANDDYTKMIARTKEDFEKMGMNIFLNHEVVKVVPEKKQVMIRSLNDNRLFIDEYDKLMISTGTYSVIPPINGVNLENVQVLKTLEDGITLKQMIASKEINDVVIVGAGYIGIEVAEAMYELGKNVRVIELGDRILSPFDEEITEIAAKELLEKGINLNLGEKLEEILGDNRVKSVKTDKGIYKADLVVLSIGVRPATKFLKDTGIAMAPNGAIIIDREMRTSVKDIYSAGDCALVYNKVMEENSFIPLGTTANKCGRIAGLNIMGKREKFIGTLGSAAIKVLDLELARTGLSESDVKNQVIDYNAVFIKAFDHPGYYPNPTPIWIKLIYEKNSKRLLGAQAIGYKGVVLRIDVFAVAIHNNMTVDDLGFTDLCYAPPFAGVWDAVHIACNAAK